MIDLHRLATTLSDLRRFVAAEASLQTFLPDLETVETQASSLLRGDLDVVPLAPGRPPAPIPDKHLAARLVELISRVPAPDGDERRELRDALAVLLANVHVAVVSALFASHPDLIPRSEGEEP